MSKVGAKSPAARTKIRYLGDLKRLTLKPGDQFVLMSPEKLSVKQMRELRALWGKAVGGNTKCIILSWGMKLGVINHAAVPKPSAAAHRRRERIAKPHN